MNNLEKFGTTFFTPVQRRDEVIKALLNGTPVVQWNKQHPLDLNDYLSEVCNQHAIDISLNFNIQQLKSEGPDLSFIPLDSDELRNGHLFLREEILRLCHLLTQLVKSKYYQLRIFSSLEESEFASCQANSLTLIESFGSSSWHWVWAKELISQGPRSQIAKQELKDTAQVNILPHGSVLFLNGDKKAFIKYANKGGWALKLSTVDLDH